jgi:hypothetical protein
VAVFFIPVYDSTGNDTNAALIIIIMWNTILLALLLVLAWVFRSREDVNPYLFVGEDEAQNAHLDTAMNVRPTNPLCDFNLCSVLRFFLQAEGQKVRQEPE